MRILMLAALLACLPSAGLADAPAPDLGGRTALDLTGPTPDAAAPGTPLASDAAGVTVPLCPDPNVGQLLWLPEGDMSGTPAEAERIAGATGVARDGDTLVLTPREGEPLRFTDWAMPARADADGDFVRYRYVGALPGKAWWTVEVQYGHDAPSTWLVNAASGHAVHVHNGGETSTLSPDGRWLATFDTNAAPYRLALVFLGDAAPSLAVDCLFTPAASERPTACGFEGGRYEARWNGAGMALERAKDQWRLLGTAPGADCRAPR